MFKWSYKLSTAIAKHTNDEETKEATRRSGGRTGRSGLTAEEAQLRADKKRHIGNYQYAQNLYQEILNEEAAQKGHVTEMLIKGSASIEALQLMAEELL